MKRQAFGTRRMRRTTGLLLLLAACGMNDGQATPSFSLSSPAFRTGQAIPVKFTCDGADRSPPLAWSDPPQGTRSFALIVDDPDAPGGTFRHWGAYDLPTTGRSLRAGQAVGAQATNGFGKPGYDGPCPPKGRGPHHYRFKLYALAVDRLAVAANPSITDVEREAQRHMLARAELTGLYARR
jgi:Raf kinase inhibitor-like YbhB/YbcL family protein